MNSFTLNTKKNKFFQYLCWFQVNKGAVTAHYDWLAKRFGVSYATIRSWITEARNLGLLKRIQIGATKWVTEMTEKAIKLFLREPENSTHIAPSYNSPIAPSSLYKEEKKKKEQLRSLVPFPKFLEGLSNENKKRLQKIPLEIISRAYRILSERIHQVKFSIEAYFIGIVNYLTPEAPMVPNWASELQETYSKTIPKEFCPYVEGNSLVVFDALPDGKVYKSYFSLSQGRPVGFLTEMYLRLLDFTKKNVYNSSIAI